MKKQLHPGAKWSFRFRTYWGFLFLLIFFGWFMIPIILSLDKVLGGTAANIWSAVFVFFILYIALVIAIAEIYARMAYKRWLYEFTPINLKIERGIIWKHYSSIPYERVQNVDIHRGILARMLGFSSVMIQTAGFSGYPGRGYGMMSEGFIPAVSEKEAESIREFLMKRISKRGRGL